jgi:hypothetical protein
VVADAYLLIVRLFDEFFAVVFFEFAFWIRSKPLVHDVYLNQNKTPSSNQLTRHASQRQQLASHPQSHKEVRHTESHAAREKIIQPQCK